MGTRLERRHLLVPGVVRVLLITVSLVIAGAGLATAEPITVIFTVAPAAGDPINSAPASGSFSFDSSLFRTSLPLSSGWAILRRKSVRMRPRTACVSLGT